LTRKGRFNGNQNACSVGEICPVWFTSVVLKVNGITSMGRFWGQLDEKTMG